LKKIIKKLKAETSSDEEVMNDIEEATNLPALPYSLSAEHLTELNQEKPNRTKQKSHQNEKNNLKLLLSMSQLREIKQSTSQQNTPPLSRTKPEFKLNESCPEVIPESDGKVNIGVSRFRQKREIGRQRLPETLNSSKGPDLEESNIILGKKRNVCHVCKDYVEFLPDSLQIAYLIFHRKCFICNQCDSPIDYFNFMMKEGKLFCIKCRL